MKIKLIEFIATFFAYAQLFTTFLIITCGAIFICLVCLMLGSEAIRRIMLHFGGYSLLFEFGWHYDDFKKWLERDKPWTTTIRENF